MRSDRQKLINEQTYKMKREEKSFTTKREEEKNPSFESVCVVCIYLLAKTIYLKKKKLRNNISYQQSTQQKAQRISGLPA